MPGILAMVLEGGRAMGTGEGGGDGDSLDVGAKDWEQRWA